MKKSFHVYKTDSEYTVEDMENQVVSTGKTYKDCLSFIRENSDIDKPTYYVIKDLMTWAIKSSNRSALERYTTLEQAMAAFQKYRVEEYNKQLEVSEEGLEYARLTLGASIRDEKGMPVELDVIHVRNDKNYLVRDFLQTTVYTQNLYFVEALEKIQEQLGLDRINIYRVPTEEEIKAEIYRRGEKYGLSKKEIETGIERNTIPKKWIITNVKEVKNIADWENDFLKKGDSLMREKKYFLDGSFNLVDKLNFGNEVYLTDDRLVRITHTQLLNENAAMSGKSIKNGQEIFFTFDEIKRLIKDQQEIRPCTLEQKIAENQKYKENIQKEIEALKADPQSSTSLSDIAYEQKLLQKIQTNIDVLEAYKKNPERINVNPMKESIITNMANKGYEYDELSSSNGYIVFESPDDRRIFADWDKVNMWEQRLQISENKEMQYLKTLAETVYKNENQGMLDYGFDRYYKKLQEDIDAKGYNSVLSELKDILSNSQKTDVQSKEKVRDLADQER